MSNLEQVVVVVPAHNEAQDLPRCLRALTTAGLCMPMPVLTVVVLDSCDDGSDRLVAQFGPDVHFVSIDSGNVGAARAAGFEYAKSVCGSAAPEQTWYATTDADSVVSPTWLSSNASHLEEGADCVAGYIDAEPAEIVSHGEAFLSRGRLEDTYLRLVAEIDEHVLADDDVVATGR